MRRLLVGLALTVAVGLGVAYAASLSVASGHLWAGAQSLTKGPTPCTLSGTSSTTDTYVDEQNPTSSFGGASTLGVSPKSGKRQWLLVRFDLSSCAIPTTGGADSATLNLRITTAPGSSRTLDVSTISSTWSGTTTWNTAPTTGAPFATITTGTTSNVTKSVTVTADVDALIKSGSANYGWLISEPSSASNVTTLFGSAENATPANQPQLVINYEK
jgi:hypothetical protein